MQFYVGLHLNIKQQKLLEPRLKAQILKNRVII